MSKKLKKIKVFANGEETGVYMSESLSFNPLGKLKEHTQYYASGEEHSKVVHFYEGEILNRTEYFESGEMTNAMEFVYDEEKEILREDLIYLDGSKTIKTFTRNKAENSETVLITDESGEVEGKEFRMYNAKGDMIIETLYEEDGETIRRQSEWKFDDSGMLGGIQVKGSEIPGGLTRSLEHEVDDKGRILKSTYFDEEGKTVLVENRAYDASGATIMEEMIDYFNGGYQCRETGYDDKGRMIWMQGINRNGDVLWQRETTYNDEDRPVEEKTMSPQGEEAKTFEYDYFDEE